MHPNSIRLMAAFAARSRERMPSGGSVLDVGSCDVNGNYRGLWDGWEYTGVDIAAGPNVDRVVDASGVWRLGQAFDVVISGQCLEHCRRPWVLAETMGRHVRPGGWVCLIAPFAWNEHRYPVDCWRIAPDGMDELLAIAGCRVVESYLSPAGEASPWHTDCVGVGEKVD